MNKTVEEKVRKYKALMEKLENLVDDTISSFDIHENPAGLLECERDDLIYLATEAYKKGVEGVKNSK